MQLLSKVAIVTIILVAIAIVATFALKHNTVQSQVTASYAKEFVLSDLYQHSPNGIFNVINVSKSPSNPNSWIIILSASYNSTKPCPTYLTETFNYPSTNLAPIINNIYASNCKVNQITTTTHGGSIGLPIMAIAEATSMQTPIVTNYISNYTYNNTFVKANFYTTFNKTLDNMTINLNGIWIVNYTATNANYSVYVILDKFGNLIKVKD